MSWQEYFAGWGDPRPQLASSGRTGLKSRLTRIGDRGVLKNQGGYSTLLFRRGGGGLLKNPGGFSTGICRLDVLSCTYQDNMNIG